MSPICTSENLYFYALDNTFLPAFYELVKQPEIGNFMRFQTAETMMDAKQILADYLHGNHAFAIFKQAQMIGVFVYKKTKTPHVYDISIFFSPTVWGKGYCSETLHTMIPYAFDVLHADAIQGYIVENNLASRKAVQSCGFREVCKFHPDDAEQTLYVYRLCKKQR